MSECLPQKQAILKVHCVKLGIPWPLLKPVLPVGQLGRLPSHKTSEKFSFLLYERVRFSRHVLFFFPGGGCGKGLKRGGGGR